MHARNDVLSSARDGAKAAWPICLGYAPIGLAFGVLSARAGLSPWQVALMSVFVFAGSAQFIAVAMIQSGAGVASIVATTFAVNLRHVLMSSALAVYLRGIGRGFLAVFAYGVTDESFAVNLPRLRDAVWDHRRALALNQTTNLAWIGSTTLGAYAGQVVPEGAFGVGYALPAMFLCLLVFQLRSRVHVVAAVSAGALATALYLAAPGNGYVIAASMVGATAAFWFERWARRCRAAP